METSAEAMGKLPAAFIKDGTVTAFNTSEINDGAVAQLITSWEFAGKNGVYISSITRACASGDVDPQ